MFQFWRKWLMAVIVIMGLFGGMIVIWGPIALPNFFGAALYSPFMGHGKAPLVLNQFDSWIFGVLGATIVGWTVTMGFIVAIPFARRERWSWWCVLISMLVWYVLDTGISLHHGNFANAAFNSVALGAALLPLVKTWRVFSR